MILLVLLGLLINNIIKQLYYLVSFVEFNEGVESVSPPKSASLKRERERGKKVRERSTGSRGSVFFYKTWET